MGKKNKDAINFMEAIFEVSQLFIPRPAPGHFRLLEAQLPGSFLRRIRHPHKPHSIANCPQRIHVEGSYPATTDQPDSVGHAIKPRESVEKGVVVRRQNEVAFALVAADRIPANGGVLRYSDRQFMIDIFPGEGSFQDPDQPGCGCNFNRCRTRMVSPVVSKLIPGAT